ncbi:MAG: glycosyltransferase family 4 protein [Planctomycetota bacterium]
MKILACHNYYQCWGGEDVSFEADVQMLRDYGHEVITLTRDNAEIDRMSRGRAARKSLWNHETEAEAREVIRKHRPDVLHCNNLFPMISPSVHRAAKEAGVPVVQALRNYRYFCPTATLYRNGRVCTDCVKKAIAYPAVMHGCYRGSKLGSAVVAGVNAYHRYSGNWRVGVDAYFTPSAFAKSVFVDAGMNATRLHVRTNFVYPDEGPSDGGGGYAVFVGRLSREKGTETLAEAWEQHKPALPLKVVGGGDSPRLARLAKQDPRVELLGLKPLQETVDLIGAAECLIFSSRWYETFGRTIAEAYSRGTPVIASDLGVMSTAVRDGQTGLLIPPGDSRALADAVNRLAANPSGTLRMRQLARQHFVDEFTRERSYEQLMRVYQAAGVALCAPESAAHHPASI